MPTQKFEKFDLPMQKILKLALPMEIGRKNTRQIDAKIKKLALQCKDLKDLHC